MTGARTPERLNQMSEEMKASESPPSPSRCSSGREQFESWYRSTCEKPVSEVEFAWLLRWKAYKQRYSDSAVNLAWGAWQAASELADKCKNGCKIKKALDDFNNSVTSDF